MFQTYQYFFKDPKGKINRQLAKIWNNDTHHHEHTFNNMKPSLFLVEAYDLKIGTIKLQYF